MSFTVILCCANEIDTNAARKISKVDVVPSIVYRYFKRAVDIMGDEAEQVQAFIL